MMMWVWWGCCLCVGLMCLVLGGQEVGDVVNQGVGVFLFVFGGFYQC